MRAVIEKSNLKGHMDAPPSKSISHRSLICAGLAQGKSRIENVIESEDLLATMDCLRTLGVKIEKCGTTILVEGIGGTRKVEEAVLFCRESGSTLRFLLPICAALGIKTRFKGEGRLLSRPMDGYKDCMKEQGLVYEKRADDIFIEGQLKGGSFSIRGDVSSQFISGLLFALPLLQEDSVIHILPPVSSRSYINLTIQSLKKAGIQIEWIKETELLVKGQQGYQCIQEEVEGDASNAAFFEALNFLGFDVEVSGLKEDSRQGDRIYKRLFLELQEGMPRISLKDCPDLGPILFALAAEWNGAIFTDTERLRLKESDRVASMKAELEKMHASIEVEENFVKIAPSCLRKPEKKLDGHNDHRIVMALSVLLLKYGGEVQGVEAVRKSMPDFFDKLIGLGAKIYIEEEM